MEKESYLYYLGKTYPLKSKIDNAAKKLTIEFDGSSFLCISPVAGELDISKAVQAFYTKVCKRMIDERLKFYQPQIKVKYKGFTIEDHQSKWGSCSSNKALTFNWRLIMLPLEAMDYVVVHELCHLVHMNHDRSFWRLVGKIYPQYKEAMKILGTEKTRDL